MLGKFEYGIIDFSKDVNSVFEFFFNVSKCLRNLLKSACTHTELEVLGGAEQEDTFVLM